jgi:hypothetical protein
MSFGLSESGDYFHDKGCFGSAELSCRSIKAVSTVPNLENSGKIVK